MERIIVLLIICYIPLLSDAQENARYKGIQFEQFLTWEQIKAKAKTENKCIFVDCFATWCGPCKKMDEDVFPLQNVGDAYNSKFISVKVQMDKIDADNEQIKKWYGDAAMLKVNYAVTAYPTFLFFYADAKPMHKAVGLRNAEEFIKVAEDAFDQQKQYYQILQNFQPGKIDTSELKGLAWSFSMSDKELAGKIAADYLKRIPLQEIIASDNLKLLSQFKDNMHVKEIAVGYIRQLYSSKNLANTHSLALVSIFKKDSSVQKIAFDYIESLHKEELYLKDNLLLITVFDNSIYTGDRLFNLYYQNGNKIDNVMSRKGFSQGVIDFIIYDKEIFPYMRLADNASSDVDWNKVFEIIKKKTNSVTAERNVIKAKVIWYQYVTDKARKERKSEEQKFGKKFSKSFAQKCEKYGLDTIGILNSSNTGNALEWSIYRYCTDRRILNEAIGWLEKIMRIIPGTSYSYVYAGILYKTGYKNEAIEWQKMTIQIIKGEDCENNRDPMKSEFYQKMFEILNKMKNDDRVENIIYWPR